MPFRLARWTVSRTIRKSTPHEAEEPEYYLTSYRTNFSSLCLRQWMIILHLMAAVSKRFYHWRPMFVTTSDALRALRIAMTFYSGTLKALTYTDVRRIEALLRSAHIDARRFAPMVPSIRSIWSLDVTYPVCTAISPAHPWTMVVVNALNVRTLLLSIRLSRANVGIWAETISSEMSTAFLNPPNPSPWAPPLALPKLRHLTALSHYIVHIFSGRDTGTVFPQLTDVELFPDAQFHAALHLLNLHIPLQSVTLWFLIDQDPATWPIFPHVDFVALNKCDIAAARLPALIARVFPGLRRLSLNHSFPKVGSSTPQALNHEIWTKKRELVRKIARANPGWRGTISTRSFFRRRESASA
ncbi:hypothetical protein B0H13DRAFT_2061768 [Mycena leptocephala]|nr:hypothetical protein B0H13DRAFT_2061768 [Mycena leptocephala]